MITTRGNPTDEPGSERVPVANAAFDNVSMTEAVESILRMANASPGYTQLVCTGNLDHLVLIDRDPEFAAIYRSADLVLADGAPVVWLSKLNARKNGAAIRERVAGSDLFWELAKASHEQGTRLFFLGGSEGAADRAADAVRLRFPNVNICGTYCPPYSSFATDEEQQKIRDAISTAKPDVLLVAFGAPKQEKWIASNRTNLDAAVAIGVGGSFEMAAGDVKRAPVWMRRIGVEWVFRFIQEPGRLWDRYFKKDIPFLVRLVAKIVVGRS